jgi:hypothetical protein
MILPRFPLERVYLPTATPGSWYWPDGTLVCKTLELPDRGNKISANPFLASCIPEGIYLLMWQAPTVARPYEYYRFQHVPGRHWHDTIKASSCLVHPANYVKQLLGCITPGSRHADLNNDGVIDIADSVKKLKWMTDNLPKYLELEIREKAA